MRLRAAALALHDDEGVRDKPDRKADVFADLGSPVSPLRLRPAAATPSSSSSSAGSAKSPAPGNAAAAAVGRGGSLGNHSGELDGSNPPRPPGQRRSGSGPLIFSGGSSSAGSVGGCVGGGGSTASSPLTNALPTGNICPSGRVAGAAAAPQPPRARPVVLGSGMGHYGHGSIMRGGGGSAGGATPARISIDAAPLHSSSSRSPASCPAPPPASSAGLQEITRPDSAACRGNRAAALIGLGRLAEAFRECEEAVRLDPASGRAHGRLAGLCVR
jgi:DnaJ family protein C protein 7